MRALALLGFGILIAGCLAGNGAEKGAVASIGAPPAPDEGRIVEGGVFDEELRPIPNARITSPALNGSASSGFDGRFVLKGIPAQNGILVTAEHPDYRPQTLRVDLLFVPRIDVRFLLEGGPGLNATHVTSQLRGFFFCEAVAGGGAHGGPVPQVRHSCGSLSSEVRSEFRVPFNPEIEAAVLELVWEPAGPGAEIMAVNASLMAGGASLDMGEAHNEGGGYYVSLFLGRSSLEPGRTAGGEIRSEIELEPGVLDDHSPANVGLAFQQSFDFYMTSFYGEAPPGSWTALKDS